MKSSVYARRTLKGLLLLFGFCILYLLSTGPAMVGLMKTENGTVAGSLRGYIRPLILIDRRFNNYDDFIRGLDERDSKASVYFSFPAPSTMHKTIMWYISLWGEDAATYYSLHYMLYR
jgi:hypothetical protein